MSASPPMSSQPSSNSTQIEIGASDSGARLIRVIGRLDVNAVATVWDRALRAVPGKDEAVLDAHQLTYCDGAGMALIGSQPIGK